jgi:hypothetical protein
MSAWNSNWTTEEREFLIRYHPIVGNRWKLYTKYLKYHTPEEIRTQWNSMQWLIHPSKRDPEAVEEQVVVVEDWSWLFQDEVWY